MKNLCSCLKSSDNHHICILDYKEPDTDTLNTFCTHSNFNNCEKHQVYLEAYNTIAEMHRKNKKL